MREKYCIFAFVNLQLCRLYAVQLHKFLSMEHILIYILSKLYWLLIYCFTVAGQVSLSDNMFSDSRQWVYEEVDSVDAASADFDIQSVSSKGVLAHSHPVIFVCFYHCFYKRIVWTADMLYKKPKAFFYGVSECPERHRVRLRFCSD